MSLKLYYHPLSSFCWKVLIALYEKRHAVHPGHGRSRQRSRTRGPVEAVADRKFPVLREEAKDRVIPESSIIIEYLDNHYPGRTGSFRRIPILARPTRLRDRFYDLLMCNLPMQKVSAIAAPAGKQRSVWRRRSQGTDRGLLWHDRQGSGGQDLGDGRGIYAVPIGASAPALFYGNMVVPFATTTKPRGLFERLKARPRSHAAQGGGAVFRDVPEIIRL